MGGGEDRSEKVNRGRGEEVGDGGLTSSSDFLSSPPTAPQRNSPQTQPNP